MDTHHEKQDEHDSFSAELLPGPLARQVEEEALEHTAASTGAATEQFRRGRVEAETHRISEEMTHLAQERRRLESPEPKRLAHPAEGEVQEEGKERVPGRETRGLLTGAETLPAPQPLRRVLVPLDNSPRSERTLPYASLLASQLQARILLAHVDTDSARTPGAAERIGPENSRWQNMQYISSYYQRLHQQIPESAEQIERLEIGASSVVEGLLTLQSTSKADLVLVALGAHSLANHLSLGQVVDTLIQRGAAPVMVIPPKAAGGGHPVTVRHILVPLDGSALAEQALSPLLGWLGQMSQDTDTRLTVTLLGVAQSHMTEQHYQSYLNAVRMILLAKPECKHIQVQAEAIVGSSVPETLVDVIEQNIFGKTFRSEPTDLLMMATHGRGGLGRWLFGSVTSYVLPRVHVPVLLVHPTFLDR
jgi:nucleotide-binding universal stress UspA family protein